MSGVAKDTIALLQYLLPGFLAAWAFYSLTSFPKPSQFERIVQALIFTLISQALVAVEKAALLLAGHYISLGLWTSDSEIVASTITGLVVGLVASFCANNDTLHRYLRRMRITRETSYPSQWFRAFLIGKTFVVLHLKDERRVYGWPQEWPSDPTKGHFVLQCASWLEGAASHPITGVESVLINVEDVELVEFMELKKEGESV
jgi:hypothetical protein